MGLGIPMVGKRTAGIICSALSSCTWEDLMNKLEFPETLPVGPMTQSAIRVFWSSLENKEMVRRLSIILPLGGDSSAMGLVTSKRTPTSSTVCISGTIKGLTRDEAKFEVERLGYRVVDSVTKSTNHLVIGNSPGAKKVSKAKELNIPISDWNTFCKK
jgi:DNA ligase (NAD+)